MTDERDAIRAEMQRTAFQKKAVSPLSGNDTIDYAIRFFTERGYRAGRTGRPGQMFVMGGREGLLPRVTAEIKIQTDVGPRKSTMVTMDATGEKLGQTMQEFRASLTKLKDTATS